MASEAAPPLAELGARSRAEDAAEGGQSWHPSAAGTSPGTRAGAPECPVGAAWVSGELREPQRPCGPAGARVSLPRPPRDGKKGRTEQQWPPRLWVWPLVTSLHCHDSVSPGSTLPEEAASCFLPGLARSTDPFQRVPSARPTRAHSAPPVPVPREAGWGARENIFLRCKSCLPQRAGRARAQKRKPAADTRESQPPSLCTHV